jgi:hypothetical protein
MAVRNNQLILGPDSDGNMYPWKYNIKSICHCHDGNEYAGQGYWPEDCKHEIEATNNYFSDFEPVTSGEYKLLHTKLNMVHFDYYNVDAVHNLSTEENNLIMCKHCDNHKIFKDYCYCYEYGIIICDGCNGKKYCTNCIKPTKFCKKCNNEILLTENKTFCDCVKIDISCGDCGGSRKCKVCLGTGFEKCRDCDNLDYVYRNCDLCCPDNREIFKINQCGNCDKSKNDDLNYNCKECIKIIKSQNKDC